MPSLTSPIFRWVATLLVATQAATHGRDAPQRSELEIQARRIGTVRTWTMRFRYSLDVEHKNDFDGMGSENKDRIEAEGEALFQRSRKRWHYECEGQSSYDVDRYSLSWVGDYRTLDVTRGSGMTDIVRDVEVNFLAFDFDDFSYSFHLMPGEERDGEVGLPCKSHQVSNITETFIREAEQAGRPVLFPDMVRAMAPDESNWSDFTDSFDVAAIHRPLPFFGTVLAGSVTTLEGGVLSWLLEPADEATDPRQGPTQAAEIARNETWLHQHPPDNGPTNRLESPWEKLTTAGYLARRAAQAGTGEKAAPLRVFLVDGATPPDGAAIATGDSLVEVELPPWREAFVTASGKAPTTGLSLLLDLEERESPSTMPPDELVRAAITALFLEDCESYSAIDARNPIEDHPLSLVSIDFADVRITVHLQGVVDNQPSGDRRLIGEQIRRTVTANHRNAPTVQVMLNENPL